MSKIMPLNIRGYNSVNNSTTKSLFKHRSIAGFVVAALSLSNPTNPVVVVPITAEVGNQTIGTVNDSDILTNTIPGVAGRVILSPTEDTPTGMNVTFRTDTADTTVEYHPTGTDQIHTAATTETGRTNRVHQFAEFVDLTPATEYEYRVITAGGASGPWDTFRTAATAPQDFDFTYFGDTQNGLAEEAKTSTRVAYNAVPNTVLAVHIGDQINDADDDEQRDQWFEAQGSTAHKVPMLTTLDNRELEGDPLVKNLQDHHTHPINGPAVLPGSTYYVDYQDVRFITLTSNNPFLSQQARFLDEASSSNLDQWSVMMLHQPVYNATTKRITTTDLWCFSDILEKHNINSVLNGHDYTYTRGHRFDNEIDGENTGLIYMISSVGPKFYEVEPENAAWDNNGANRKVWAKGIATYAKALVQSCTMTIDPVTTREGANNYTSTSINGAGQTVDSFTVDKRGGSKQVHDNIQWPVKHAENT